MNLRGRTIEPAAGGAGQNPPQLNANQNPNPPAEENPNPPAEEHPAPPQPAVNPKRRALSRFDVEIFPTEIEGSKLFKEATASRDKDEKLTLSLDDSATVLDNFRTDAQKFAWGNQVFAVKISNSGEVMSIFEDHENLSLNLLKKQAAETWTGVTMDLDDDAAVVDMTRRVSDVQQISDEMFQKRVRSTMIADRILGSMKDSVKKALEANKANYQ